MGQWSAEQERESLKDKTHNLLGGSAAGVETRDATRGVDGEAVEDGWGAEVDVRASETMVERRRAYTSGEGSVWQGERVGGDGAEHMVSLGDAGLRESGGARGRDIWFHHEAGVGSELVN
ncbi:uncharacterized protein A4U43_C08F22670 [Asparagus officinalis]|nr:uncharacterized protein A4U43_C08F22670 [Asparagus officinalis]